jgi:hypothetical protein
LQDALSVIGVVCALGPPAASVLSKSHHAALLGALQRLRGSLKQSLDFLRQTASGDSTSGPIGEMLRRARLPVASRVKALCEEQHARTKEHLRSLRKAELAAKMAVENAMIDDATPEVVAAETGKLTQARKALASANSSSAADKLQLLGMVREAAPELLVELLWSGQVRTTANGVREVPAHLWAADA